MRLINVITMIMIISIIIITNSIDFITKVSITVIMLTTNKNNNISNIINNYIRC